MKVELVNLAFSVDSILVAVAMSRKIWVILTGGLLGIVAMRVVIGQLLTIVRRYPALVDGAFIIIAWVGIKLLIEYLHALGFVHFEINKWFSFGADRRDLRASRTSTRAAKARSRTRKDDEARRY